MARKTTGTTTTRSKKKPVAFPVEAVVEVSKEIRTNGKAISQAAAAMAPPVNLEEEIRRRAYELYLERRATAGAESGDENQDWLVAEREIRSRQGGREQHSA
jgi:Protein of unknown function (DUF2934)